MAKSYDVIDLQEKDGVTRFTVLPSERMNGDRRRNQSEKVNSEKELELIDNSRSGVYRCYALMHDFKLTQMQTMLDEVRKAQVGIRLYMDGYMFDLSVGLCEGIKKRNTSDRTGYSRKRYIPSTRDTGKFDEDINYHKVFELDILGRDGETVFVTDLERVSNRGGKRYKSEEAPSLEAGEYLIECYHGRKKFNLDEYRKICADSEPFEDHLGHVYRKFLIKGLIPRNKKMEKETDTIQSETSSVADAEPLVATNREIDYPTLPDVREPNYSPMSGREVDYPALSGSILELLAQHLPHLARTVDVQQLELVTENKLDTIIGLLGQLVATQPSVIVANGEVEIPYVEPVEMSSFDHSANLLDMVFVNMLFDKLDSYIQDWKYSEDKAYIEVCKDMRMLNSKFTTERLKYLERNPRIESGFDKENAKYYYKRLFMRDENGKVVKRPKKKKEVNHEAE